MEKVPAVTSLCRFLTFFSLLPKKYILSVVFVFVFIAPHSSFVLSVLIIFLYYYESEERAFVFLVIAHHSRVVDFVICASCPLRCFAFLSLPISSSLW